MERTRKHFSQDVLIDSAKQAISKSLSVHHKKDPVNGMSTIDCIMSALAVFTFKAPSLLQFDEKFRLDVMRRANIKRLFGLEHVLSDTGMRQRLDRVPASRIRRAFTKIFALLQRAHLLDHFKFLDNSYLISIDGTGYFSSSSIHCEQCCVKEHKNGSKTYYHQMLSAALVHYDQKVVYPFAPEPILKQDGAEKNDCERNAAKRWLEEFRREHPHLPVTIVADGLSSNQPFIELLLHHHMNYILVCKDDDHKYLVDWLHAADSQDAPYIEIEESKVIGKYQYMHNVPLNSSHKLLVNVLRYWETDKKTGKVRQWMWVTNFKLTSKNVRAIMKGGRARWRIENETFNTLKNQGYNFEHNYGHGYQHLSTTLAYLMLLAFFIDQVLQSVNKLFCLAYEKSGAKYALWEGMRAVISFLNIQSFEEMYQRIAHPPPQQEGLLA